MTRGGTRTGAGRPRSDDPRRSLTVRLPGATRAALDAYAAREGVSLSDAVTEAVEQLASQSGATGGRP